MISLSSLLLILLWAGSPTLVALIVTRGRVLLGPWIPRAAWPLGAAVVLGPIVVALTALFGGAALQLGPLNVILAIGAPLGEELGWRGVLNPWLERRFGWLGGAIATGAVWALWHLPVMFDGFNGFPEFAAGLIAASIVIAFLHERSGHSLFVPLLAHASMNLGLLQAPAAGRLPRLIAWTLLAVASVAVRARAGRPSTPGHPDTAAPASRPRP